MHRLFKIYRAYFQWTRKRTLRIFKKNPRYSLEQFKCLRLFASFAYQN